MSALLTCHSNSKGDSVPLEGPSCQTVRRAYKKLYPVGSEVVNHVYTLCKSPGLERLDVLGWSYSVCENRVISGYYNNNFLKNMSENREQLESLIPPFLLHDFDDILEQETKNCIHKLANQMKSGESIDSNACMHLAIINVMFSAAFGSSDIDSCNFELFQKILYVLEKHSDSKRSSKILKPQELNIISSREKDLVLLLRADFRLLVYRLIELARKIPSIDEDTTVHIIEELFLISRETLHMKIKRIYQYLLVKGTITQEKFVISKNFFASTSEEFNPLSQKDYAGYFWNLSHNNSNTGDAKGLSSIADKDSNIPKGVLISSSLHKLQKDTKTSKIWSEQSPYSVLHSLYSPRKQGMVYRDHFKWKSFHLGVPVVYRNDEKSFNTTTEK
ncbi:unnamed protein product [Rhizopus stolonifer]